MTVLEFVALGFLILAVGIIIVLPKLLRIWMVALCKAWTDAVTHVREWWRERGIEEIRTEQITRRREYGMLVGHPQERMELAEYILNAIPNGGKRIIELTKEALAEKSLDELKEMKKLIEAEIKKKEKALGIKRRRGCIYLVIGPKEYLLEL